MEQGIGIYKCTYDFNVETPEDMELRKGDVVQVTKQISPEWFKGSNGVAFGQFPVNFVEQVFPEALNHVAIALSDFVSDHQDDLNFSKGDVIAITRNIDANWYHGFTKLGSGMFPKTFVREISFVDTATTNCDSNNNKEKANGAPEYGEAKVIDSFQAQETGELTISAGDIVYLTREIDSFWIEGILNDKVGKFPRMYVEIIKDLPEDLKCQEEKPEKSTEPQAKALFMFVGTNSEELSFDKGDLITLVERLNKDWLVGKIGNTLGRFPTSYVEILVDLPFTMKVTNDVKPRNSLKPKERPKPPLKKEDAPSPVKGLQVLKDDQNPVKSPSQSVHRTHTKPIHSNTNDKSPGKTPHTLHSTVQRPTKPLHNKSPVKPPQHLHPPDRSPTKTLQPVVAKVVASNIPPVQKRRASQPPPLRTASFKSYATSSEPSRNVEKPFETLSNASLKFSKIEDMKQLKPSPTPGTQSKSVEAKSQKSPNIEPQINRNKQINSQAPKTGPPVQRKSSLLGKKKAPSTPPHQFEFVEEKIFDMYSKPTSKPLISNRPGSTDAKRKPKLPPSPSSPKSVGDQDLLSSLQPKSTKSVPKLPKPLAPMPLAASPLKPPPINKARPMSLSLPPKHDIQQFPESSPSPVSSINAKSFAASFSKRKSAVEFQGNTLPRSETDPSLSTNLSVPDEPVMKPAISANGLTRDRPKSLYFASANHSTPSPEKRSQTLDAVLQRSSSLRAPTRPDIQIGRKFSTSNGGTTPTLSCDSTESLSQNSQDLKRIDTEIAELKSKIEAEAHLLAGVETLLDFVTEDKKKDLYSKQDQHNANIIEMNEDLNALEDQKSYLLASFGKVDDIVHRVEELEKQIDMYLDNCEQLRLMQDVAVVEELPEIRDSIEFCENMVDTLQDELNGLKAKLGEMGQLEPSDAVEDDIEEKKKKKQIKVTEELITTEIRYCNDISQLLATMQALEAITEDTDIQTEVLFGNLPDIVQLSAKLLQQLNDINLDDAKDSIMKSVAMAFVDLSHEMKNCYAVYCRNYDDAQMLKEKYEEDPITWNYIANAISENSDAEEGFNLGSYLIKPVQRVLKYPLLLSELWKNQLEEGLVKMELKLATDTMTDVATAINEFKRRKELVQKYRETEDGLGKRVQKLNWHSVAKKSSRINQKITQFTGLNTQTVDETFNDEEKRFRAIEKLIKTILKNVVEFSEEFKENSTFEKQCAESFRQLLEGEDAHEEMVTGYHRMFKITEQYTDDMINFIKIHVTEPLSQLLQLFHAPFRLIQKRHDKCLDYDRAKNKSQRAKDSKEKDKIYQTEQELQACENVYAALNSQLLEEMPLLNQKCASFVLYCLQNFTEARKRYFTKTFFELDALWQLPFFKKDVDIFESYKERLQKASEDLCNLAYVPNQSGNKDTLRRSAPPIPLQQPNQPTTNFFVDLDMKANNTISPKQEPTLIDLDGDEDNGNNDELLVDISSPTHPSLGFDANSILVPNKVSIERKSPDTENAPGTIKTYVVRYDFVAQNASEITLDAGTEVEIIRRCDKSGNSEWWLVECGDRKGYIPASFISEVLRTQQQTTEVSNSKHIESKEQTPNSVFHSSDNVAASQEKIVSNSMFYSGEVPDVNPQPKTLEESSLDCVSSLTDRTSDSDFYILEYDFEAMNSGELGANEGQLVTCLAKHDQKGNNEWWLVEYDGQRGYIPRDYLLLVDDSKMC